VFLSFLSSGNPAKKHEPPERGALYTTIRVPFKLFLLASAQDISMEDFFFIELQLAYKLQLPSNMLTT